MEYIAIAAKLVVGMVGILVFLRVAGKAQMAQLTPLDTVSAFVIGALVGMALSALAFILRGRNRDLLSSQQVVAERYAILAASDVDRAFTLLQRTPGNMARPKRAREVTERPKKDSVGFFPDGRPRFGAATKEGDIPSEGPEASAASSTNDAVAPSHVTQAVSPVSSASESEAAQTAAPAQPAPAQPAPEGRDDAPASSSEKRSTRSGPFNPARSVGRPDTSSPLDPSSPYARRRAQFTVVDGKDGASDD